MLENRSSTNQPSPNFIHWWLVRITLVVAYGFLLKTFGGDR